MRRLHYISILTCIILLGVFLYFNLSAYQTIKGTIFGTYYTIKIRTNRPNPDLKTLIEAELGRINREMSVFEPESELSQINRASKNEEIILSSDMSEVMSAASEVFTQSEGWFDPTLGKLVDLWGFGAGPNQTPSDQEIADAQKVSGFNKLIFDSRFSSLRKTNSATYINLSAIAKGYGVDKVAALLEACGYHDYLIEIGGEIRAGGSRSDKGEAWNIGINRPQSGSHDNVMVISASNISIATSGNYRNFYQQDGKTFAHTISYQTGRPVLNDALSVSVFHDSCMYADAYATAIMAMGVDKGLAFADKYKLKVIIIDNQFASKLSHEAKRMFEEK